ncbi:MAG: universal stress protein [Candidatus Nitrosopolaris sp.]
MKRLRRRLKHGLINFKKKLLLILRSIVGAVVNYAEHNGVDLIVIGSRRLSGLKKLLLGSTASGVLVVK